MPLIGLIYLERGDVVVGKVALVTEVGATDQGTQLALQIFQLDCTYAG